MLAKTITKIISIKKKILRELQNNHLELNKHHQVLTDKMIHIRSAFVG